MKETIAFQLNGRPARLETDPNRFLIWALRSELALTGTKYGCGIGLCGACAVLVDKKAVRSCRVTLKDVQGKEVTTIEGLVQAEKLTPVQQAFIDHGAMQCGFCTPGMIVHAHSLLLANPDLTEADAVRGMEGNLCRCGAHPRIIQAILSAALKLKARAQNGNPS